MGHNSLDELRQSMVRILNADGKTAGSGFIIRADGYLVTCHHVIYLLESLTVEYLGQQYSAEWCEELSNPEVDIAILKIPVENAVAVSIVNPPELATAVTVYGFPPKQEKFFPEGFPVAGENIQPSAPLNVLATYRTQNITANNPWNKLPQPDANFLSHRINAKVDPGTSGGPVLVTEFEGVVGVIQCSKSDESYVIRWDNILPQLDQLGLEPEKNAVYQFLSEIEDNFKHIKLFHTQQPIVLTDQYIPIQVTLERRYKKLTEDIGSYAESEAELRQIYALKGTDNELQLKEEIKRKIVDWEEAKKDHKTIVLLADPGMGKSTLLRMEALTTAQQERQKLENQQTVDEIIFPLFLRLSEIAKTDAEIFDIIPDLIQLNHVKTFEQIKHLLEQKLEQGKCLLLLDALDEVPTDQRILLIEKLSRFTRNYPSKIISTSRIVGYGGSPVDNAKELEIVPFSQQQTESYIQTWFNNAQEHLEDDSVSAEGLIQELQNKPQIKGLAQNPLLLSLLCSLYQTKGLILPARKAQVYEQAVNYMLSDWRSDNRRLASEAGWVVAKKKLLAVLAYQFSSEGKEVFGEEELWEKINKFLQLENILDFRNTTPTELIRELTEEDGIIQKLDRTGDRYLFLHRTFQEYFTASYLNKSQDISLAKPLFWNYNQHETLILLAGMMKDSIPLIEAIYQEKDDIFKTQLLLVGRCIAESGEISHPIVTKVINKIYQFWQKYPRLRGIELNIVTLAQKSSQLLKFLIDTLQNEENYDIRGYALQILVQVSSREALEALNFALKDENKYVRVYVASVLATMGNSKAVKALIAALQDEDKYVMELAAEALGKIGNREGVKALIDLLQHEDSYYRENAAHALEQVDNPEVQSLLIDLLEHKDSRIKGHATLALAQIENFGEVPPLIDALQHEDSSVRYLAVEGLARIGKSEVVPLLTNSLQDEDRYIRGMAALSLGQIGNTEAIQALIAALQHEDFYVRGHAAQALGQFDNPEVVQALIGAFLQNDHHFVQSQITIALGNIGITEVVQRLIFLLQDKHPLIRREAALVLRRINSAETVRPLINALQDEDSEVRSIAADALRRISNNEILQQLIQNPEIEIYADDIFSLARKLAIEFSNENLPFIPVYPELVRYSPLKAYIQRSLYSYKTLKKIPILPTATLAILVTLLATVVILHFSGIYSLPFLRDSQPEESSP